MDDDVSKKTQLSNKLAYIAFVRYLRILKCMKSLFVESILFEKYRSQYLNDDEYRLFQADLMVNPKQGDVIQGTGGLRKIRVASKGKGKRGGSRVIYYYLDDKTRFYLLTIYSKNEVTDLTAEHKKQLKAFLEVWQNEQT